MSMEVEYKDTNRRGKFIVVFGVILALLSGGAAFYLISAAQQNAGQAPLQKVAVVVAARDIPARKPIEPDDLVVREVPIDATNEKGISAKVEDFTGKVLAVTVFQGQIVTTNLIASNAGATGFSILEPNETVGPDSEAWRAVSLTISDDRAVGGLLAAGQLVDIFVTAQVNVPQELQTEGIYYTDRSTKITYQNVLILARAGSFYIIKAPLVVAEEISHLQASGNATFSAALRPEQDVRIVDVSRLGSTTNLIITKYGLPIPETYPVGGGVPATLPPIESASPSPSGGASPAP